MVTGAPIEYASLLDDMVVITSDNLKDALTKQYDQRWPLRIVVTGNAIGSDVRTDDKFIAVQVDIEDFRFATGRGEKLALVKEVAMGVGRALTLDRLTEEVGRILAVRSFYSGSVYKFNAETFAELLRLWDRFAKERAFERAA